MNRLLAFGLVALLCACAKSSDPAQGSQTHFLVECESSCPSPLECVCGVCTTPCDDNDACAMLSSEAQCLAPANGSACGSTETVCDVECNSDDDCEPIGDALSCEDGRCRGLMSVAGEGGVGGTGGTGGTGGVSGTSGMGGTGGTEPTDLGEICDGSTGMRFGYSADGGFVDGWFYFTNPYGHWFLFIDGQCKYYASMNGVIEGIATGTLDAEQAEQIALNSGWNAVDELSIRDDESCPDAGTDSIWFPSGQQLTCTCGCDPSPVSQRKTDALDYIRGLMEVLAQGEKLDGPVAAMAAASPADGSELQWPLDTPLTGIANLVHDLNMLRDDYAVFEDAADAAALRALRSTAQPGTQLLVTDGQDTYQLHLRDQLPQSVDAAINQLRANP